MTSQIFEYNYLDYGDPSENRKIMTIYSMIEDHIAEQSQYQNGKKTFQRYLDVRHRNISCVTFRIPFGVSDHAVLTHLAGVFPFLVLLTMGSLQRREMR